MLYYSKEPAQISGSFLSYRNDILVFTEDEQKDKEFYISLLQRLVSDTVSIKDVIPLGCRKNVIDACSSSTSSKRHEVYIIDSDIDLINDGVEEVHENLFPLPFYCSENILFDEKAIIEIAYLDCGKKTRTEISQNFDFETRVIADFRIIYDLFVHFALCRKASIPYTLHRYEEFFSTGKSIDDCQNLIRQKINLLKTFLEQNFGVHTYQKKVAEITRKWPFSLYTVSTIISGKNYLIPYAKSIISELSGKSCYHSRESLKLRLSTICDLSRLKSLRDFIQTKVKSGDQRSPESDPAN